MVIKTREGYERFNNKWQIQICGGELEHKIKDKEEAPLHQLN